MKKNPTLKRINIKDVFWYFILFSILGFFIETIFCYITTGVMESKKGLIWGPFCPIYGIGSIVLIFALTRYRNSDLRIFIYGGFLGCAIEYCMSFLLETIYGCRFWDYSYLPFNFNGRICLTYSLYWAILSLLLIKIIKPATDKVLAKIPFGIKKILEIVLIIFLCVDCLATIWGITVYKNRALDVYYHREPNFIDNNIFSRIGNEYFTDIRMYPIFPNLRIIDTNNQEQFIRDILKDAGKI